MCSCVFRLDKCRIKDVFDGFKALLRIISQSHYTRRMDATEIRQTSANTFSDLRCHNVEGDHSLHIRTQNNNLSSSRVFADVCATVADHVINTIPCSMSVFFERQQIPISIQMEEKENNVCCVLHGDMVQLAAAERCLQKHLGFNCPPDTCDKSVLCELITSDKPYSIALDRPRRRLTTRLTSLNNTKISSGPAVRIKEKYNKAKRKTARAKTLILMSKRPGKNVVNPQLNETESGKENVDRNDSQHQQVDLLDNLDPPHIFSDGEEQLEDEASEEDSSPKKQKKNYEELTPFKFFCEICSYKTKRESHFQKHLAIHSKVNTLYKCNKCPFTSIRLTHLRRHEMSHSQTMFSCKQCSYKTDEQKLLMRHVKLKHERAEVSKSHPCAAEDLQCQECPYKTTRQSRFQRHLRVHESGGRGIVRIYQCDQCVYKTNRKEHYIRHVNNVHINKRPFLCDFCGKAFKRPDALKQHRVTHNNTESRENTFRCSVCQKGCRSQAHLNEHQAVHSNVRSFLCEMCGASFKTRSVQRKHMLTIHKNPRSYACEHCSKRFNTNYALRRHLRLHASGASMTEDTEEIVHQEGDMIVTMTVNRGAHDQQQELPGNSVNDGRGPSTIINHVLTTTGTIPISIHRLTPMNPDASVTTVQIDGDRVLGNSMSQETTTTLIPLQDALEHVAGEVTQQVPQTFVASEATTALLYLTTNFTM